jgi:hypothetical protein
VRMFMCVCVSLSRNESTEATNWYVVHCTFLCGLLYYLSGFKCVCLCLVEQKWKHGSNQLVRSALHIFEYI